MASICDQIKEEGKRNEDKLRIALVYIMSFPELPDKDKDEIERALEKQECDTRSLKYVRR